MNDEELSDRLATFGPVPGCERRPAGMTRLLALRLHALCRGSKLTKVLPARDSPINEVEASYLGPVLLEYLNASRVVIQTKGRVLPDSNISNFRGVVVLDTMVNRLLPRSIANFDHPPLQINRFSGGLGMPASVTIWVLMGELYRVGGPSREHRELIERISDLPSEWRDFYPEMGRTFVPNPPGAPPEQVLKVTPEDILRSSLPKMRRKLSQSKALHTWQVVDEAEIRERIKARADDKDPSPGIMRVLEDLALHYKRVLPAARQKQAEAVDQLVQRFPNFAPVCRWVSDQIRLHALTRAPLHLPPMLLLGPPGVGKTMFSIELAQTVGAEACLRSLGELSASWLITGASAQWANGRPGVIAEHLSRCPKDQMPWFIFDELDKASKDRGFPVGPALLGLLEPYTAQRFREECLEIEMDIRPATFIFTANELDRIRPELISRLHVIAVPEPTAFEMPAVVASVDAQLRKEQPGLSRVFSPLDTEVLIHLEAQPPRNLRQHLQAAYANAVRRTGQQRGRRDLLLKDLPAGVGRGNSVRGRVH